MRDTMNVIEEFRKSGKIVNRYDMKASDALAIREACKDDYELITRSFMFGYAQGYKFCCAEKRNRG